jgi:hypothetical protein
MARENGRASSRAVRSALAIHLVARAASVAALTAAVALHRAAGVSFGGQLGAGLAKSDGVWYLAIAHHGYGSPPPATEVGIHAPHASLAFFPLYPLATRAVALTGLPYLGAALLVTAIAGCLAAVTVAEWARGPVGDRGALMLLAAWELLPSSIALSLAYSEAMFAAAAALCLLALQRRRWLLAGVAAGVGGLARPTGGALVLAVVVAVVVELRRSNDRAWGRWLGAIVLSAGGLAASLIHVALVTHRLDGWFRLESTVWRSGFDGGDSAARTIGQLVAGGTAAQRIPDYVATLALLAVIGLAVRSWRRRPRPDVPSGWYAAAVAVLAIGERSYFYVKPRLLLVGFPGLLPVGAWLARQRRDLLVAIGVPAVALSLAYNAYLVAVWRRAL